MAGIPSDIWTVIILTDDPEFHRVYRESPETALSQVMQTWRDDCRLFGNWYFTSTNGDTEYDLKFMTLEMVGEVYPNAAAVNLRAQLLKKTPASKIIAYLGGAFHHITVTPNQRLTEVLWRLAKGPLSLEHAGTPLDPSKTIKQTGLQNNAVVCESRCSIQVKLSTNVIQTIQMEKDSLVFQLIDRVRYFEFNNDFSLMYRGKQLELHENIKDLKQVIHVTRADFVVNFKYRRITFQTKGQAVTFSDFLSHLSTKAQLKKQELEEMKYFCTGCQRCIWKSDTENHEQVMPIDCCEAKSLSLMAKTAYETNNESEWEEKAKFIQRIYDDLLRNAASEVSREDCKRLKDRLEDQGIGYNGVAKWRRELRKIIGDFERKIKTLEEEKKKLQGDLETTNETLKARNVELEVERVKKVNLEATMKNLEEEITANKEIIERSNVELETQRAKNVELEANIRNHLETLGTNVTKLLNESTATNETMKAKTGELETNMNRLLEESKGSNETLKAKNIDLEVERTKNIDLQISMKTFLKTLEANMTKYVEQSTERNERMKVKTETLAVNMKYHLNELVTNTKEFLEEVSACIMAMKAKTTKLETNMQKRLEESIANNQTMKAKTEDLDTSMKNHLNELVMNTKEFLEMPTGGNETVKAKTEDLATNMKKLLEEFRTSTKEFLKGSLTNNETMKAKTIKLETSMQKRLEESIANNETMMAKTEDLETSMKNHLNELVMNTKEFLEESTADNETMKTKTTEMETSMQTHLDESIGRNEAMKVQSEDLKTNIKHRLDELRGYMRNFVLFNIDLGVKLFIKYRHEEFSPIDSRPEVQSLGKCSLWASRHFIRCEVAELRPGWTSFEAVRAAIQPFFTGPDIRDIYQRRGSVDWREFVEVTSLKDNQASSNPDFFLSPDGREIRGNDVKSYQGGWITEGGQILIPNGQRRAVLEIRK